MNAKEARAKLLDGSTQILDNILFRAVGVDDGDGNRVKVDNKAESMIIDIIKPMLQAESDVKKMNADSAHGVIEMLQDGAISAKEAIDLMDMLGVKSTIDTEKGILIELQKHSALPSGFE